MTMQEPRDLTIQDAVLQMQAGELTAVGLVESCLERIRAREATVRAWVEVYEQAALDEARRCDLEARQGRWRGPLHGIPFGIKDIIHVRGMWTRAGTPVYPAHVADEDAPVIARLRHAGAIFLGKTETTPFANNDPAITRNPWNPEHTPGGSSSGSGAAVADRMCPAALGTQTGGSLLRPAAYNGIVGFKATYGVVSNDGVIPNSWSLDHVGVHARCVATPRSSGPVSAKKILGRSLGCLNRPCSRARGSAAPRRAWGTSGSSSRRKRLPKCWRTSRARASGSCRPAPRSSSSPSRPLLAM